MDELTISMISAAISAGGALISLFGCFYTNKQTKKMNNLNIKARYFEKIFDDYLIYKIPEARMYIRFNESGKLDDFQKLIDILCEMRKAALFFKFDNKSFYSDLKSSTQELEDYLSKCGNRKFDYEEQADIHKIIGEKMTAIYACISNCYLGISSHKKIKKE